MTELYKKGSEWRKWDLHVHTASSYDYKYGGEKPNEELIRALRDNNVSVVAITDHFVIDKDRIRELKAAAPEIIFFPGVELRTDKGDTNIHVILIFNENFDLDILATDFEVFKRSSGKSIEDNEKIFLEYRDIVDFAKKHSAIISIHAGTKTNGIDKQISNVLPANIAVKDDYAKTVDIFEGGNVTKDNEEYKKYKFPKYGVKPLIFCSDNHNPMKYEPPAPCWIKADPTFEGLKQVIIEPERVFIGEMPELLKKIECAPQKFIKHLSVNKKESSKLDEVWYNNFELELNPGLVAIIGNKGSGKSAIADILGLCSNVFVDLNKSDKTWSFLTREKFRKPKPYDRSKEFEAKITWVDGNCSDIIPLNSDCDGNKPARARYIPQSFLETLCTAEDEKTFETELKSIIFQYLPQEQKKGNANLDDVIASLSIELNRSEEAIISHIKEENARIVDLESKKNPAYKLSKENALSLKKEELDNLVKAKPKEVEKPTPGNADSSSLQEEVESLSKDLNSVNNEIAKAKDELGKIANLRRNISQIKDIFSRLKEYVGSAKNDVQKLLNDFDFKADDVITFSLNETLIEERNNRLDRIYQNIQEKINPENPDGLEKKQKEISEKLQEKRNKLGEPNRLYQKYLDDLKQWEIRCAEIKGNADTPETVLFYEREIKYLTESLDGDLNLALENRTKYVNDLIEKKRQRLETRATLYTPVEQFINNNKDILKDFPIKIKSTFVFENFSEKFLNFINQNISGSFCGKEAGLQRIKSLCEVVDFSKNESIINFVKEINTGLMCDLRDEGRSSRNPEMQLTKGHSKIELYDFIYCLSYIKPLFQLQMSEKTLSSLSPGERGAILLLFYLFIDNDDKPLIIDQPEENLDNQSVFNYLVTFIKAAKKKRQIIMITHNPNLAVVCDADQIIKMDIAKDNKNTVSYQSGSIENPVINKCIVDILEGTYPAFDNRNKKYLNKVKD